MTGIAPFKCCCNLPTCPSSPHTMPSPRPPPPSHLLLHFNEFFFLLHLSLLYPPKSSSGDVSIRRPHLSGSLFGLTVPFSCPNRPLPPDSLGGICVFGRAIIYPPIESQHGRGQGRHGACPRVLGKSHSGICALLCWRLRR